MSHGKLTTHDLIVKFRQILQQQVHNVVKRFNLKQKIGNQQLKSEKFQSKMVRLNFPAQTVVFLIVVNAAYVESCKKKKQGSATSRIGGQTAHPPEIKIRVSEVGKLIIMEGQPAVDKIHSIQFRGKGVEINEDQSIKIPPTLNICESLGEKVKIRYDTKLSKNATTKVTLRYRPNITSLDEITALINSSICIDEQDGSVNLETSVDTLRQMENPLFNECFKQV